MFIKQLRNFEFLKIGLKNHGKCVFQKSEQPFEFLKKEYEYVKELCITYTCAKLQITIFKRKARDLFLFLPIFKFRQIWAVQKVLYGVFFRVIDEKRT